MCVYACTCFVALVLKGSGLTAFLCLTFKTEKGPEVIKRQSSHNNPMHDINTDYSMPIQDGASIQVSIKNI